MTPHSQQGFDFDASAPDIAVAKGWDTGNEERRTAADIVNDAYLSYSMYTLHDRALPQIADGLKPVQRRILHAMAELKLDHKAKPKKSARTVGDVLGKYHPHGDGACYEAMVHMAQPFATRYPLVHGQGNWGSTDDPRSFAAMRYTEARLTAYTETLLSEVHAGACRWRPNFDGTLEEPCELPAQLPNIVLNGTTGIAVGMTTDIPSHNADDVARACIALLRHPDIGNDAVHALVPGPDLPTGARITSTPAEITTVYTKGQGTLRMRARWHREADTVIVDELPHQTSPSKIVEQIARAMNARELPMIRDLRDEADQDAPVRIAIDLRRDTDTDAVMEHLCAATDLERTLRVNFTALGRDGRPRRRSFADMLREWLAIRREVTEHRTRHRLSQIETALHRLDAILKALDRLDWVIHTIRTEPAPTPALMHGLDIDEAQADAILALRLRSLARLEEQRLLDQRSTLLDERNMLEERLRNPAAMTATLVDEIQHATQRVADPRRTGLEPAPPAQTLPPNERTSIEPITVVLSRAGYIRAARGHDIDPVSLNYRNGDALASAARAHTNHRIIVLDTGGRAFTLPATGLASARSLGEPLSARFHRTGGTDWISLVTGPDDAQVLMTSSAGDGFITTIGALSSDRRAGKACMTTPPGHRPLPALLLGDPNAERMVLISSDAMCSIVDTNEAPRIPKGKGNRLLSIPKKDPATLYMHLAALTNAQCTLVFYDADDTEIGRLTPKQQEKYRSKRAMRGTRLPLGLRNVHRIESEPPRPPQR